MGKQVLFLSILLHTLHVNSQENWTKYGDGPVLKRDTVIADLSNDFFAISDNWVLKDGAIYKMWYTCAGFNYPTDDFNMRARICYCESTDGINWEKHAENPVLDVDYTSGWDSLAVETASVIIDLEAPTEARFKMWYAGLTQDGNIYNLGYAYSPDGKNWTKHPEPILEVGSLTEWDNGFLEGPSVIKEDGAYKMWYAALDTSFDGSSTDGYVNIGYATSSDGINWSKYAENPVLTVSETGWDSIYVQDPHVIRAEDGYHLWYGGANQYDFYGQQTGYAFSPDGISWTKSAMNPVLKNGESDEWDDNTASFPSVLLEEDGQLKMWYTGKDVDPLPDGSSDYFWEIGYAIGDTLTLDLKKETIQMTVYPNPFTDQITIQSTAKLGHIKLYNALGETVWENTTNTKKTSFDSTNLTPGIYFLHTNSRALKLVKNNAN